MPSNDCSNCHGAGTITVTVDDDENESVDEYTVTCPKCNGSGKS